MDGLLSFLIFAGLFYFMMRFGCGAHMVHGHHENTKGTDTKKHIDPVCGMQVDPDKGYGKMHKGALYRFCSRNCLDKFESAPDTYIKSKEDQGGTA